MSKPVGPYTPAMHAGDFLMISGQIGHVDGTLVDGGLDVCLLYTSPSPRDRQKSRMPSSA